MNFLHTAEGQEQALQGSSDSTQSDEDLIGPG